MTMRERRAARAACRCRRREPHLSPRDVPDGNAGDARFRNYLITMVTVTVHLIYRAVLASDDGDSALNRPAAPAANAEAGIAFVGPNLRDHTVLNALSP